MKTILLSTVLLVLSVQSSLTDPPIKVMKAFKQKFPSAINIKWNEEDNKSNVTCCINGKIVKYLQDDENTWKADFILGDKKTSATFDLEGHWLVSWQELKWDDLGLEEVKEAIKKDFPDYKNEKITIYNDVFEGTHYRVRGKYYDWTGNTWPPKQ